MNRLSPNHCWRTEGFVVSDVMKIAGAVCFVVAGFIVDVVAGLIVLGLLLVIAGWLVERNGAV